MNKTALPRRQGVSEGTAGMSGLLSGCISNTSSNGPGDSDKEAGQNTTTVGSTTNDGKNSETTENKDDQQNTETQETDQRRISFEIKQIESTAGGPVQPRTDQTQLGAVRLYESASEIPTEKIVGLQRDGDEIKQFIDETDFDTQRLIYIESVGPTGCHDDITVDNLAVEDETLVGEAAVETPSKGVLCTDVITYPRAFVRVDGMIKQAEIKITNGWEETQKVQSQR